MVFSSRLSLAFLLFAGAGLLGAASCSSDWDLLDPRIDGASDGTGAGGGSGGAGATGGSGGDAGGASVGGNATGGSGAGGTGAGGMGGTGGLPPGTLNVIASVADCVDTLNPDPDACEAIDGAGHLSVDGLVTATGNPSYGFLRFDIDDTLAGRTVTSVLLQLTVSDHADAGAPESGDVWEVETFTRPDLFVAVPAQLGGAPLAPSLIGDVVNGDLVELTLPVDSVAANAPTTLGIYLSITNGVRYWNLNGAVPPALVIDYQ